MDKTAIGQDIYWVGVVDWNLREFHGYRTGRGSTYNSYLILDEKKCVVDTVKAPFSAEFIAQLREFTALEDIDYIVANHLELDHAGAVADLSRLCPKAKILATGQWIENGRKYFGPDLPVQQVHTGDTISLGRNTLTFLETPMLHWPDSMATYLPEQKILLSNDAFGQHYASSLRFDDQAPGQFLLEEAAKYYANIVWPYSVQVTGLIKKVTELRLEFKTIAPSHGFIWRKDPGKIIAAYQRWAAGETKAEAVMVYDTMWGSTEIISRLVAEGLEEEQVPVSVMSLKASDQSDVALAALESRGILIGTPVLNNLPFPSIAGMFTYLKGLKPKNKLWGLFGSYGWNKSILPAFGEEFKKAGFDMPLPVFQTKYRPDAEERKAAVEFGRQMGQAIKGK